MKSTHVYRWLRVAAAAVAAGASAGAHAQCQDQKLLGSNSAAADNFGRRVALDGDRLAVAGPLHTGVGLNSGSVYVYRLEAGAWVQEQEITPPDAEAGDQFGFWIAMSAGRLLIGAKFDDDLGLDAGSAYVFRREGTTWVHEQKLLPSDGLAGDNFGNSVALAGDLAVIGSPTHNGPVADSGAAYVFRREPTGWVEEAKLTANDAVINDQLAFTVALSGDRALLGAWMADPPAGIDAGSAYVFRRDGTTWSQEARLDGAESAAADRFAVGVALSADLAIVGADLADPGALASAGVTYIFRRTGTAWAQEARLIAPDTAAGDQFGFSVATDGLTLITTAINADKPPVLNSGAAYIYQHAGGVWTFRTRVTADDAAAGDLFGSHVAFDPARLVVGARQDDDLGTDSGSAYVFAWPGCLCYPDCNTDGSLTVADFGCFQTKFVSMDPYADCNADTQLTVADFGCFQTKFVAGCP